MAQQVRGFTVLGPSRPSQSQINLFGLSTNYYNFGPTAWASSLTSADGRSVFEILVSAGERLRVFVQVNRSQSVVLAKTDGKKKKGGCCGGGKKEKKSDTN